MRPCSEWGLAVPLSLPSERWLLPRRFTLTPWRFRAHRGGLFSVALSSKSPHRALPAPCPVSSDFPPAGARAPPFSGRPRQTEPAIVCLAATAEVRTPARRFVEVISPSHPMSGISVTPERLDVEIEEGWGLAAQLFECAGRRRADHVEVEASDAWLDVALDEERGGFPSRFHPNSRVNRSPLGSIAELVRDRRRDVQERAVPVLVTVGSSAIDSGVEVVVDPPAATQQAESADAPVPSRKPSADRAASGRTRRSRAARPSTRAVGSNVFHPSESLFMARSSRCSCRGDSREARFAARAERAPCPRSRYRQDPATSSIALARVLGWGAPRFGGRCPAILRSRRCIRRAHRSA